MEDLVSIIVPIYNSEKFIDECIKSILNQTYKNIELILVNDGSTDRSLEICRKYEKEDKRIIVINKKNEGVAIARNYGIERASGKYIGFVDSDDSINEKLYETLISNIMKDKTKVVVLNKYTIKKNIRYKKNIVESKTAINDILRLRFPTSLWAYLYHKDLIKNIQLNNEIHFFEDLEFNIRILMAVKKISICNDALYNYRNNLDSINNVQINDKHLSCLKISNYLESHNNKCSINSFNYINSHFIVSLILKLVKNKRYEDKYILSIKTHIKKYLNNIVIDLKVPIMYKLILIAFMVEHKGVINLLSIKNKLK